MKYSKDIILGINCSKLNNKGQARKRNKKILALFKKHKFIATISIICGILIVLDYILVHNFIILLQTLL